MTEKRRLTAVKTRIAPVVTGKFITQEGFNPNYVLTDFGKLSRVRILATVVDKFISESGKMASLTLDDGTSTIRAKAFGGMAMFNSIEVGSIVDVIGRVKEYHGEVYLSPETTTVLDVNHELLRELEIRNSHRDLDDKKKIVMDFKNTVQSTDELKRMMRERYAIPEEYTEALLESMPQKNNDYNEKVLALIEKMDKGDGCDYSDLIAASGLAEQIVESAINDLLNEGTCFEPRPGKIKKL
ncbi:MAG: hypothetical protein HY513_02480 [Candidatus Aenigmarchaeota archaeon]|nr:hypothetical protein [Candidatus Aenigmarchaeota archaeon]